MRWRRGRARRRIEGARGGGGLFAWAVRRLDGAGGRAGGGDAWAGRVRGGGGARGVGGEVTPRRGEARRATSRTLRLALPSDLGPGGGAVTAVPRLPHDT